MEKMKQKVFLQYNVSSSNWPHLEEMSKVIEYELPLCGKMKITDFRNGKVRTYSVKKQIKKL